MPNAHDYSYNVEIGVRANAGDVKKAKKTLRSVAEILNEIELEEKLSQEAKAVEEAAKKAARNVRRLNNVMDVARKIARDYSDASNYDDLLKTTGELADIREEELEQYKELADAVKGAREEREEYKDLEKEINEAAQNAAKEVEYQDQRRIERLEVIKGSFGAISGAIANVLQLGDVWSETLSTTKRITEGIDKFLFGGIKKKLNEKISGIKKEEAAEAAKLKELSKLEKKGIKEAHKLRQKLSKERDKDFEKDASKAAGGDDGDGGGGVFSIFGGGGKGGGKGAMRLLKSIKVVMIAIQAAVGSVVGIFKVLIKILTLGSDVLEEFHTITYAAAGGAEALGITIANLTVGRQKDGNVHFLIEEIKNATKSLVHLGFGLEDTSDNFEQLVVRIASFNRVTGIATDKLAKFVRIQQAQGEFTSNTMIALGKLTETMKDYALTTDEATTILDYTNDQLFRMNVTFGHVEKGGAKLIDALSSIAAAAKLMGLDVSESTKAFDLLFQDMTQLIIATQGMSLRGPLKGLEALVMNIDNIIQSLPDDPFARDIVLKNVYGIDEKQLNLFEKMHDEYEDWKSEQKKIAKENKRFIDESELSFQRWTEASKKAENISNSIEQMAQESNNNIQRSMQLLRDKVLAAFMKIGVSLMPAFVEMANVLMQVVSAGMQAFFGVDIDFARFEEGMQQASAMSIRMAEEQKDIIALQEKRKKHQEKVDDTIKQIQEGKIKAGSKESEIIKDSLKARQKELDAEEDAIKQKNYVAIANKKLAEQNKDGLKKLKPGGWIGELKSVLMEVADALKGLIAVLKAIHNVGQNIKRPFSQISEHWGGVLKGERNVFEGVGYDPKPDPLTTPPEVEAEIARIKAEKAKAAEAKSKPTKTPGQVDATATIEKGSGGGETNVTVNTNNENIEKHMKESVEVQKQNVELTKQMSDRIGRSSKSSAGRTSAQSWD